MGRPQGLLRLIFSYGVPQFSTSLGDGNADEHVAGYVVEFG